MLFSGDSRLKSALAFFILNSAILFSQETLVENVWCQSRHFAYGDIITTRPIGSERNYCGGTVGWFFAVQTNILFHLQCAGTAGPPQQARVVILNMNDRSTRLRTFSNEIKCDIQVGAVTTGYNANLIVNKIVGSWVPYDITTCNSKHYVEYLAYGQTSSQPKATCPVFKTFTVDTNVNDIASFRLAARTGYYVWPERNSGSRLSLSPSKNRSFQWNPLSAMSGRNFGRSALQRFRKKGSSGGGGHSVGGGEGARGGGGSEGSEGSSGSSGAAAAAAAAAAAGANGGGNRHRGQSSAASRARPPWRLFG